MPDLNNQVPFVNLSNYIIELDAIKLIPENIARKYTMIPLFLIRNTLTIAILDPSNVPAIDEARLCSGNEIQTLRADDAEINMAIEQNYNLAGSMQGTIKDIERMAEDFLAGREVDVNRIQKIVEEPPVIKLVNLIIFQALKEKASDIHIEPEETRVKVRFRIDGVLHNMLSFSSRIHMAIVSRVKVIARMNIVESRLPQDGHLTMLSGERKVDIRVSTFPITFGEKVEMRILDRSSGVAELNKLGLSDALLSKFEGMIRKPYGIILITGPTGSGKTSTLYAALSKLNSQEKNIITLEDPREYILQGINQAEVNSAIGFTFANGLRTILRQDPDIIMVGEIRDAETAQIAIRAALTGRLVLSTLHTNDAPGAITRLIDMEIEPFLIASGIIGIISQRLVRVICLKCKESYIPEEEAYKKIGLNPENPVKLYRGKGCMHCRQTGYKGRVGIFELMLMNNEIRQVTIKNRPTADIRETANKTGLISLQQDGFDKVLAGITTLDEVLRVTYIDDK